MPKTVIPYNIILVFLIVFVVGIVAIIYLKPTHLEAFEGSDSVSGVIELYKRGYAVISGQTESTVYNDDEAYLRNFPFSEYSVEDTSEQGKFYIDITDDTVKGSIKDKKGWEVHLLKEIQTHCKPGSIAMDIGAHIGTHTIPMSKYVGRSGQVYAFEPNKKIYRELCYNLETNGVSNVIPVRAAVGNSNEIIAMNTPNKTNEGNTLVVSANDVNNTNAAFSIRLDDLNLNNVSFMKIDVEGYEANVIQGAKETILRNKPVILIEIWDKNGQEVNKITGVDLREKSINLLKSLNYSVNHISDDDFLAVPNAL